MQLAGFTRQLIISFFVLALCAAARADEPAKDTKRSQPPTEITKSARELLPDQLGDFRAGPPNAFAKAAPAADERTLSTAGRTYKTAGGAHVTVTLKQTEMDSAAYALLTAEAARRRGADANAQVTKVEQVGTAAFAAPGVVAFFKGPVFARVEYEDNANHDAAVELARQLAATLDTGTGVIPPLVEHLPAGAGAERAVYAVSLPQLQAAIGEQPVLDALSFAGGTEAVAARYDQGQLVIVEFATPQLAGEADAALAQRVAELRAQGQPVPSVYKRVGNYAVFVFGATDEQAATALAKQVKYEKVVQWLGEDPHRYERANRYWLNMSTSIIVNTVKATGLAILLCLGIGGLFGSVIFRRRRAHVALNEKYTDAGGMMRLNLDDMAADDVQSRLLPPQQD